MSSIKKNIRREVVAKKAAKVAIVQSTYNAEITEKLAETCVAELKAAGITTNNISVTKVPGAWEIPFACQQAAKKKPDVIIALGCIIKGQTPHFDFIANEVSRGIMDLSLKKDLPIIFGVLTTLNLAQAKARTKGGIRGDKGVEAAQAAIKMINL